MVMWEELSEQNWEQKGTEADWGNLEHSVESGRVQRNVQGKVGSWAGRANS